MPAPNSPPLADVFEAAAHIISDVLRGRTPDAALATLSNTLRSATMDMSFTTLRAYGRGDFLLSRLLDRKLKDPALHGLLLAALARLEAQPDTAHTIVNQAVAAAERLQRNPAQRAKGLINAVLRRFLRERSDLLALAAQDEVARWQHSTWWIQRLRADHPQQWQSLLEIGNTHPPMCLRVNRRRASVEAYLAQLESIGLVARHLGDDALLLAQPVAVDRLPGFNDGLCSVQDAGAQRAASLLDVRDGMRVLDACAAPGGKAAHLLECAQIDLLALDADAKRTQRIAHNLTRLGLRATTATYDARAVDAWWDGRRFDRILADVPCSASGVVRRHPDAKWLRRESDVSQFTATQAEIIDAVWRTLAQDGKMLYATCSVFSEENQQQIAAFLARHPEARLQDQLALLPSPEHDGFFYALLQKN